MRSLVTRPIVLLFGATMFLSALLLFWVQLMIAKMILPRLGGTPAVWTTCMLFFQVLLLAGYSYVLVTTAWIGARAQSILHVIVLLLSLLYLPLASANVTSVSERNNPALWLFGQLLLAIGLPIFLISTTSPLLQKWFTRTRHTAAGDPYFLFAVSNAGSLVALLSYPLILEPILSLSTQNRLWVVLYVTFLVLSVCCVFVLWKSLRPSPTVDQKQAAASPIGLKRRLYWILLSFIPASLLFGVTTYITTEIAPTPLLWTIPLALYLLTFVLAFAGKNLLPERFATVALGGSALLITLVIAANATEPTTAIVLLHLCFFFVAATICHNKLAGDRPSAARLADFYLCVAVGGMLGGVFNTLIAPMIFNRIVEYPLAIVLAACLIPRESSKDDSLKNRAFDVLWPAWMGILTVALAHLVAGADMSPVMSVAIVFGAPLVIINHRFRTRPIRFALALGAVMVAGVVWSEIQNITIHSERNFFGTLSVKVDEPSMTHVLYHGNTIHGRQFMAPEYQREPLSYFHREGPLGQIFDAFYSNAASPNVAVIGLGTGSMACYSFPGQQWTFYEINPAVVAIAQTTDLFTYLQKCAARSLNIVLGDARLQLQNAPDQHYGLIVLDAFNSDAIPIHLMTNEAIALYMSKLATGGILAFHISNRSLKLDTVLANLAKRNGATCLSFADGKQNALVGKDPSEWLVMAKQSPAFDVLAQNPNWRAVEGNGSRVWTDDFSNIVSVLRWY